jgi:hypothetical protein
MSQAGKAKTPGEIFHDLLSALQGDAMAAAKKPIAAFFDDIIADPSVGNVIARGAQLAPEVIASAPQLEDTAVQQIARAGKALTNLIPAK